MELTSKKILNTLKENYDDFKFIKDSLELLKNTNPILNNIYYKSVAAIKDLKDVALDADVQKIKISKRENDDFIKQGIYLELDFRYKLVCIKSMKDMTNFDLKKSKELIDKMFGDQPSDANIVTFEYNENLDKYRNIEYNYEDLNIFTVDYFKSQIESCNFEAFKFYINNINKNEKIE